MSLLMKPLTFYCALFLFLLAGVDFTGRMETLVFEPFSTSTTMCYNISLIDNSLPEHSTAKMFTLHLGNATSGVVIPTNDLTVFLVDDDGAPPTTPAPQRTSVFAAVIGALLAMFLVVMIFIMILVILLARKKRNRSLPYIKKKLCLIQPYHCPL